MRLGKDKQTGLAGFFLVFSLIISGQPVMSHKFHFDGDLQKNIVIASDHSITINYSISELDVASFTDDNGSFYRVIIPGHTPTSLPGKPEMPVFSRLITVPENYTYSIKITEVRSSRIDPGRKKIEGILFPSQEADIKEIGQNKPFTIDKASYATREFIKYDTVRIEPVGTVRQKKLANILISPVRYNPHSNQIEVITSMKIEIKFLETAGTKAPLQESALFNASLGKGVLNYNPEDVIPGYTDQPVKMVIVTDTVFRKHLEPFIKWKTQKGFILDILYKGVHFSGDDYASLKDTLKNIYNSYTGNNPPPEYLLIIGDVSRVPRYGTVQITDMYYGEFSGNDDYIPEMFIGRLPVKDTTELKSVTNKIIQYEKFEFADTNKFYSNSLITAGYDASYATFMNGQVKYGITNYLTPANKINEYHFYYPQQSQTAHKDSVIELINKGVSFVNYTGHGASSGWLHLKIDTSDVRKLTNKNMYPFIISNACLTSRFDVSSLGNKMVVSKDKGAIGFIGCSSDSHWFEDFYWAVGVCTPSENVTYETSGLGAYDRMFHTHGEPASEWYYTMGQINYAGNLAVSASTSSRKKYYWETYNLVGDPSVIPVIGTPKTFNIVLPDTLPNNIRSYSFTAEPFSYIAVSHFDTLWDASFASASGSVTLDMPGIKDDSCLFVITGQNKIPLIKTVYFSGISDEFINLNKTEIKDISGNNNGLADFGETLFLSLTISNQGSTDSRNLSAKILSTSEWVTINSDYVKIDTLASGKEIILQDDLSITIAEYVPDNGIITIDLILKDDTYEKLYKIDICVHAPVLEILSCQIDDSKTGNGNTIADPGETFKLVFRTRNIGSSSTSGLFNISSPSESITVLEPTKNSGTLITGETVEIPVLVHLSETVSSGTTISVLTLLDCNPYFVKRDFSFRVGRIRESFESGTFNVFPWINKSSKPWIITESGPFDGIMSAKSGAISHNSSSSLIILTYYPTADSIKFGYKVSSEPGYDFFIFKINNTEAFKKSGETLWEKKSIAVPAGYNKMEWIYRKDQSVSGGSDYAMIDMIDFAALGTVRFISKDLIAGRIVSPVQKEDLDKESVTVKVLYAGSDTVKGFDMAYKVNDELPVIQHFSDKLFLSGDSVSVTFNSKIDLSRYGIYNVIVYFDDSDNDYLQNDTLKVNIENNDIDEPLLVYPNPFTRELNIIINSEADGTAHITLTNSLGKKLMDFKREVISGMNEILINDMRLASGVYYLKVVYPGSSRVISIVKTKQ